MPERHAEKSGTPTMGGFVILVSTIIPTLFWADLKNEYIWLVTMAMLAFGAIGFMDDSLKLRNVKGKGISGKTKLFFQVLFALLVGAFLYSRGDFNTQLTIPFFRACHPRSRDILYPSLCIHHRGVFQRR